MTELKPCPFCGPQHEDSGAEPQLIEHSSVWLSDWSIRCGNCAIEIGGEDQEDAIKCWNARAAINAMPDTVRIAELEAALETIAHKAGSVSHARDIAMEALRG